MGGFMQRHFCGEISTAPIVGEVPAGLLRSVVSQ